MRCVFLLFDSLNRHMLGAYGGTRIETPNFDRLAARSVTFDGHYIGSMPCMPARRDMQSGRLTFLHRSWGPLEPFDNSFPELLYQQGVYSHLITDHAHYFEDGGATYHNRYDSFDFIRGQEGDAWKAMVQPHWDRLREKYHARQFDTAARTYKRKNMVNREFIKEERDYPSVQCFAKGLEFLELNRDADNWLLQIETFDPHEPFDAPERFRQKYKTGWNGPIRDWPRYGRVDELPEECEELRANYYGVALCDFLLGQLLDEFDKHDLWRDTALIMTTDHGFLLGEHDFWAKNRMNMYQEIAHIPLFAYHPAHADRAGTRRAPLTQNIDLAATFVDMFGAERPAEMQGQSLLPHIAGAAPGREAVLFGYFGGAINLADGRHTYHRYPPDLRNQEVYQYTVMPTHLWNRFTPQELAPATLAPPFGWTKQVPLLKVPAVPTTPVDSPSWYENYGPGCLLEDVTRLYDVQTDPGQQAPLDDADLEARLAATMAALMAATEAPDEAFARVGLQRPTA